ncbi:hypothetical protein F5B20DRAFT_528379 [Whalleya microplaca]|nr:hypothetical protein F5B20DRAFT_528379 [Whalleya microplaca]
MFGYRLVAQFVLTVAPRRVADHPQRLAVWFKVRFPCPGTYALDRSRSLNIRDSCVHVMSRRFTPSPLLSHNKPC